MKEWGIHDVNVTGAITNNSVDATVRISDSLGFNMYTVSNGTSTFELKDWNGKVRDAGTIRAVFLANLNGEYGQILSTDEVINKIIHRWFE